MDIEFFTSISIHLIRRLINDNHNLNHSFRLLLHHRNHSRRRRNRRFRNRIRRLPEVLKVPFL